LKATTEKRLSLAAVQDKDKILLAIQADAVMRQRWDRYCKENYYAHGIAFEEPMGILIKLLS
jgi:hypothetical protein